MGFHLARILMCLIYCVLQTDWARVWGRGVRFGSTRRRELAFAPRAGAKVDLAPPLA